MKSVLLNFAAVLSTVFCGAYGVAQTVSCAAGYQQFPIYCQGTGGCHGSLMLQFPYGGPGGYGLTPATIYCCGVPNTTYVQTQICWYTKLLDPQIQELLRSLPNRDALFVATCKGNFVPLDAAVGEDEFRVRPTKIPLS